MRITITAQISGLRNGAPWPAPGETVDMPSEEAEQLISLGFAEAAGSKRSDTADAPPAGEIADAPPPERKRKPRAKRK